MCTLPENDNEILTEATYDGLREALEAAAQADVILQRWRDAVRTIYTELHKILKGEMTADELKKRICLIVDTMDGEQKDLALQAWVKCEATKAVKEAAAKPKTKRTR